MTHEGPTPAQPAIGAILSWPWTDGDTAVGKRLRKSPFGGPPSPEGLWQILGQTDADSTLGWSEVIYMLGPDFTVLDAGDA